jgi:hypothetical protein
VTRAVVILRLGAAHRVSGWAKTPRAGRGWRLILSPYQDVPDLDAFDPDEILPRQGGKWDALHDLLTDRPDLLDAPRIWLPDDDIEADPATVARFLDLAAAERLELAQPALTPDSHFSHAIAIRHPLARLRRTDFVEQMAPLLRASPSSTPRRWPIAGRWAGTWPAGPGPAGWISTPTGRTGSAGAPGAGAARG